MVGFHQTNVESHKPYKSECKLYVAVCISRQKPTIMINANNHTGTTHCGLGFSIDL
jgi:hypothetical protein